MHIDVPLVPPPETLLDWIQNHPLRFYRENEIFFNIIGFVITIGTLIVSLYLWFTKDSVDNKGNVNPKKKTKSNNNKNL